MLMEGQTVVKHRVCLEVSKVEKWGKGRKGIFFFLETQKYDQTNFWLASTDKPANVVGPN